MIPLRDHQSTNKFPLITYAIIAANIAVFFLEITAPDPDGFISSYALVPVHVNFSNITTLFPFISSQFLHAGFIHIIGNMWFLKIFGDNVEERFGSFFYLLVYLFSGIVGGLIQYMFSPGLDIPILGASGAVAGVLGAYLVFFPKHRIETLVPMGLFSRAINLPASMILIYWFVIQIFSGVGSVAVSQVGGVAWWAHVGGFATGYFFARLFASRGKKDDLSFEGYEYVN